MSAVKPRRESAARTRRDLPRADRQRQEVRHLGGTFEAGNVRDERDDVWRTPRLAGSLFIAIDTPLGPTHLACGHAEGGEQSFCLFVGQIF